MNLDQLMAWAQDKTRFQGPGDYADFCEAYLDFIFHGLQAVIVSQNENHYRFFQYREDGNFNVTRPVNSRLFLSQEDFVQALSLIHICTVPVTCRLDCPEGCRCLCTVRRQGEVYAAPAAGGVEVRFTLEFDCLPVQTLSVPAVCGGSLGEARGADGEKRPSVVLRFAAPGEEVWDIAKAYGATTAQILQANELEEETLPAGRMLLIPNAR